MKGQSVYLLVLGGMALVAGLGAGEQEGITVHVGKDGVEFFAGKELVTRYHVDAQAAKPYFWPVNAPGGIPVTRAWPMEKGQKGESTDHVHQKSAWFTHGSILAEGLAGPGEKAKGIDFWSEEKGAGRILCTVVGEPQIEPGHGWIKTHNEWRTAGGKKVLEETRTIHLFLLGTARLLVLDIDLEASVMPISFGDTKEGSMGIRVNDLLCEAKGKGTIENADGKVGEAECWGRQSRWCDYSGPIQGQTVGIALLDDPGNPPACWHSRAYGLMAANPFGRDKSGFPAVKGRSDLIRLAKGGHLKLRYGILIHFSSAREGKVEEGFQQFVKLGGK